MFVLSRSNELIASQITLNSNDAIYDGDYISIALSDDGGNLLANQDASCRIGRDNIMIISARLATKQERSLYYDRD